MSLRQLEHMLWPNYVNMLISIQTNFHLMPHEGHWYLLWTVINWIGKNVDALLSHIIYMNIGEQPYTLHEICSLALVG